MIPIMKLIDILDATQIPVTYRMAFLTNFLREPLLRRMQKETGLIRPELTVLICLNFRGDLNARDICEITEQPPNTVSRAVASLAERGYISRTPDKIDTRRQVLNLLPDGKAVHDDVMSNFAAAEQRMLEILDQDEVRVLTALLDKLARDVERWK